MRDNSLNQTKYLSEPELNALKASLVKFSTKDARNTALLELMLYAGCRPQEALNVRSLDLNPSDQTIFLRGLKASKDREIPLPDFLFKKLTKLSQSGNQKLFPFSMRRFQQIWFEFRPVKKKLHSLRHTAALGLYQKTKDIRLVQVFLGHRSITNTMIYLEYSYRAEELRKALLE